MPIPLPTIPPVNPPSITDPSVPRCPKCGKTENQECNRSDCPREKEPVKNEKS